MNGTVVRGVGALLIACATCATSAAQRFVEASRTDARYLQTADGATWVPTGCNICFERLARPTAEARALFDGWMTAFAANGGDFMRVWLSTPFTEVMPGAPEAFSAEATENLKWLVARAEKLGIRLKFTFENFRSIPERITDVRAEKGIVSFQRPTYRAHAQTMKAFFESPDCRRIYLAKARHVAEAVGDSPAVIAVECWNEITSTGVSIEVLDAWTAYMMPRLQELFPRQMVLQNLGSFSGPGECADYDWLARVRGNDFLQAHRYLDLGSAYDICRGAMDVLCADSIRELRDRRADLPVFLSETGAVEPNHTGPSHLYALDKEGLLLHDEIFAPFFAGSAGSGQPWHWDHQYIAANDLWWHFKRFRNAIAGLDPAAEHFRPFHTESHRVRFWGLRGEKTTVIWCRDKRADWTTCLERREKPETVPAFRLPHGFDTAASYAWYLPWTDTRVTEKTPRAPSFTISAVVRFPSCP